MPTPHFTFRLPREETARLKEIASIYFDGAPNMASNFVRELIGAIVAGDQKRVVDFLTRLHVKVTGQLVFDLKEEMQSLPHGRKRPRRPLKKGGRRGKAPR